MIPGLFRQVAKNLAQGPVDRVANAGYEGTAIAVRPGTAAQTSTSRWTSLNGQPDQLINDYVQHLGQALAEDFQALTRGDPLPTRIATTAAQPTSMGAGVAGIVNSPVAGDPQLLPRCQAAPRTWPPPESTRWPT